MKKIRIANTNHLVAHPFGLLKGIDFIDYQEGSIVENAQELQEGRVDVALISIADYALSGSYVALDFGVGCYAASRRLVLYGASELGELKTIYLSEKSIGFSAFLKVLLKDVWKIAPRLTVTEEDVSPRELKRKEGVLVFHEESVAFPVQGYPVAEDVVQAWYDWSGHPFTFFVWATRPEALSLKQHQKLNEIFYVCNKAREEISRKISNKAVLPLSYLRDYLPESFLHYHLNDEMKDGFDFFIGLASRDNLLPERTYSSATYKLKDRTTSQIPESLSITDLLTRAVEGKRLSIRDGVRLVEKSSLADLGMAADLRRQKLFSKHTLSYTSAQSVESLMSLENPGELVMMLKETGVSRLLLVPPYGKLEDPTVYEQLLLSLKVSGRVEIEGFGPPQILELSRKSGLPVDQVLSRLITAGLDCVVGWGGGFLVNRKVSGLDQNQVNIRDWFQVMQSAHRFGANSSCYIHITRGETWEQRLVHLHRLRALQDITGGFRYFYVLADGEDGLARFQMTMIAKLFLDNIPSIHEVNLDSEDLIGVLSLHSGANTADILFSNGDAQDLQDTLEMLSALGERELELETNVFRGSHPRSIN